MSATGALAGLLERGRTVWDEDLDAPTLVSSAAAHPYVVALLAERSAPLIAVVPRSSDAEALADGLAAFLGPDRVGVLPAWETLPGERLSPQPAIVGRRAAVLGRLRADGAARLDVLVAPVRAALQPIDPRVADRRPLVVTTGARAFDGLIDELAQLGYARVPTVTERGEFAVRGGIVDVFPTAAEHAVRLEFFGDVVEGLRAFAVADQRSLGPLDAATVDVARELVLDATLTERAHRALVHAVDPAHAEALAALAEGRAVEGVEALAIALAERRALVTDLAPPGTGLVLVDALRCLERARALADEAAVLADVGWRVSVDGSTPRPVGFAAPDELVAGVTGPVRHLEPFGAEELGRFDTRPWDSFRGDVPALAAALAGRLAAGERVVVAVDAEGPARRVVDVLAEHDVPAALVEHVGRDGGGRVEVVVAPLRTGFRAPGLGLALLGITDVFGLRRRRASRRIGARGRAGDAVVHLEDGDAVVHRVHGVGRFRGMVTRELTGIDGRSARRDYVVVEYAGGDRLYVPSDQVDALARYQGGEDPAVMRLGGAQWERAKAKVRSAARDIAAELIRLYAVRMRAPGRAVAPGSPMLAELADAFAHVETPDQLQVIDEIERDMETPLPMDRLLAGDVGFGKTEVAVRAAGKAVFDGAQVAVLVPTTILAQQHAETFRERFSGFPVAIEVLSRFVTDRDRKRVLEGLAAGTVDIVIGTHALLSPAVRFRDLGLVIVDEEHRFGVAHKEALKRLRTSVDVLSMSATPIPRTLEMAVSGIRDLSVIETPPEDRQPVVTSVQPHDETQVALAIRRELLRDGQVFYVHNQVESIDRVAAELGELVPDARIGVAHGQMDERELERVMLAFWERDLDVLVCTTIIESGLDVPNANTLIVERADLLGLAQLHQLRGRVGRSSERGYAYLLHPADSAMTDLAHERLAVIAERSRLGSGLAIAMRDLELRGAGNVIGADQSGHVAAVGLETYAELLREEVADLSGEPIVVEPEVTLDLPVDANLPHDYVADDDARLDLYRRIAAVRDARGVADLQQELTDRFGAPPPATVRLLALAALKAALLRAGITEVQLTGRARLRVAPVEPSAEAMADLERERPGTTWRPDDRVLEVPIPRRRPGDLVAWVGGVVRAVVAGGSRA